MHIARQILLSVFVLFFRISRWGGSMKARTATSGLTLVEGAGAISICVWAQVFFHYHAAVNHWIIAIALVILYSLNEHYVVNQQAGESFDEEFDSFFETKQLALYIAAISVTLAAGGSLYYSVSAYRSVFGIG